MSEIGDNSRELARRLSYTEYESEEMAMRKAKQVGDFLDEELEELRIDELNSRLLDIESDYVDIAPVEFGAVDIALAAWSNWGAGSFERAASQSHLTKHQFIVLNDSFDDLVRMSENNK